MDREYVKFLLTDPVEDNDRKIQVGEYIDNDLIELFRSNPKNINRCFAPYKSLPLGAKYDVECICDICHQTYDNKLSKTAIIRYVKEQKSTCNKCMKNQQRIKEEQRKFEIEDRKIEREINTQLYIGDYLAPYNKWHKDVKYSEMRRAIECGNVDDTVIANYIKQMKYSDFLKTPYWKYISWKTKYRANNVCALCGKGGKLNVHHKSYENHGYEHCWKGANDLIVLCQNCHAKFHDKVGG